MAPFQVFFVKGVKTLFARGSNEEKLAAIETYCKDPNPDALLIFVADHISIPADARRMVIVRKSVVGLTEASLTRFVRQAARAVALPGWVNVLLTTNNEMRSLNLRFRGKNTPTDVLSFSPIAPLPVRFAGDIAISAEMAARNARNLGHSPAEEVKILALHGVMHLAGYDHEGESAVMARKEQRLRRSLNLPMLPLERIGLPQPPPWRRDKGDEDEGSKDPGELHLHGFVSKPEIQKLNRNSIFVFVNGRLIRDHLVQHAIIEAYRNIIPPTVFPVVLLFLEVPNAEVDVNVHPSKTEVRFRQQTIIHVIEVAVIYAKLVAKACPVQVRRLGRDRSGHNDEQQKKDTADANAAGARAVIPGALVL